MKKKKKKDCVLKLNRIIKKLTYTEQWRIYKKRFFDFYKRHEHEQKHTMSNNNINNNKNNNDRTWNKINCKQKYRIIKMKKERKKMCTALHGNKIVEMMKKKDE